MRAGREEMTCRNWCDVRVLNGDCCCAGTAAVICYLEIDEAGPAAFAASIIHFPVEGGRRGIPGL